MAYLQKNPMMAILMALAVLTSVACTDDKEPSSVDAGTHNPDGGNTGPDAANSPDAQASPPDASSATDCEAWCGVRAPNEETEGWCPIDGFGKEARDCVQACDKLAQTAPVEPLQRCVEEDPLCFTTMDQCLLGAEREANCISWCDFRTAEHAKEGFCEPSLLGVPGGTCVSICVRSLQDEYPTDSVQECVRNNPLCFVDLAGCAAP